MDNNNNFDVKMYVGEAASVEDNVPLITSTTIKQEDDVIIMGDEQEQEMWLQKQQQNDNDLLIDLNHASIFYDDFPPLPDFTCMSSSSSSSSSPPLANKLAAPSPSSSNASWPLWRSDSSEGKKDLIKAYISTTQQQMEMDGPPAGQIDVMENFGYMGVKDQNDIWGTSSLFQSGSTSTASPEQIMMVAQDSIQQQQQYSQEENGGGGFSYFLQGNSELSAIFLEWLKQNRDRISAKDLRSIKLKRSTIESASKRLGSGKEGKKQLLKLILLWVEHNQLQNKPKINNPTTHLSPSPPPPSYHFYQDPLQNPNPNPENFFYCNNNNYVPLVDPNNPPAVLPNYADRSVAYPAPSIRYACTDPYSNGLESNNIVNGSYFPSSTAPMMDSSLETWSDHDVNGNSNAYQVFDANGERLVKPGPLATKEARKKRMARHRRLNGVHHRHFNHQNQQVQSQPHEQMWGNYPSSQAIAIDPSLYWSQAAAAPPPLPAPLVSPNFDHEWLEGHPEPPGGRDQGHKTETNLHLRFLLQKVLKQSDVGNLGRIVLPKKEAELHLPELNSRDGIPITMEDIGTSNVWTMRYRFWPNNKSRMYLLENTGGFVRLNSLQEGDFIVLYSEIKSGKYLIRGVKVRPTESKPECKKAARKGQAVKLLTT